MTRTLVIQLGRLGDVIQTTPLLGELAAGGDVVDVLVLRSTHVALLGFSGVANIITIPDALKPLDDAVACGFPSGEIPAEVDELLADLDLPLYDRVIHASHAALGCWLAAAIPCTNPSARFGGVIVDRECLYLGAASAYRVALLQFREQNLFNVVDLLRALPGLKLANARPRLYVDQAVELPFALPAGRRVALNPGASEAARCWPAENFARVADALSDAGFVTVLVGVPSDRELCEEVGAAARVAIPNFAGRTSIPEMATLLASCELVVSADTGAAHLAAAVGTTVLGLYGASAWFAETAPYGDGHLILQTRLNAPMSAISVDAAIAAALHRLDRLPLADLCAELRRQNQFAWETSAQPPRSADPLGGLTYRPLHAASSASEDAFARSLRRAFALEFSSSASTAEDLWLASSDARSTRASALKSDTRNATDALAQVLDCMEVVANRCADSTRTGLESPGVGAGSRELMAAMERLRAVTNEPAWKPLGAIIHNLDWQLRMLPRQPLEPTLRAHARVYACAARVLRNANASYMAGKDRLSAEEKSGVNLIQGRKRGGTGA